MLTSDFKYLIAYIVPVLGIYFLHLDGLWLFGIPIVAFVITPLIELMIPVDIYNHSEETLVRKDNQVYFDALLFLNVPLIYLMAYTFFTHMHTYNTTWEFIGALSSTGIVLGAVGINVAHELGHKKGKLHQLASKALLLPSLYMHFLVEHNQGHHLRVATLEDPATSRKNEIIYFFWIRSTVMGYLSAWQIQKKNLKRAKLSFFSMKNEMLKFTMLQCAYLAIITYFFGLYGLFIAILVAIHSFLMLETVNYIEHYGLLRKKLPNGRYERVEKIHSWNSDHQLGRILLYELTRHSDHHYIANKKYQTLLHYDESPQLPLGYPGSMLIAMFPPLWFKIMNPLVENYRSTHNMPQVLA